MLLQGAAQFAFVSGVATLLIPIEREVPVGFDLNVRKLWLVAGEEAWVDGLKFEVVVVGPLPVAAETEKERRLVGNLVVYIPARWSVEKSPSK
ncbi:hypothetical protein IAD21_03255 [Abditibacteriota bacterium]|nr:hypothetical protein IAD21_03255 [Abditibacteriota bacterium]